MANICRYLAALIVAFVGFVPVQVAAGPPAGMQSLGSIFLRFTDIHTTVTAAVYGTDCCVGRLPAYYGHIFQSDGYDPCSLGWLAFPDFGEIEIDVCADYIAAGDGSGSLEYWYFSGAPTVTGRIRPLVSGDAIEDSLSSFDDCFSNVLGTCDPSLCRGDVVPLGPGDYAEWAASNAFLVGGYLTVILFGYCQPLGEVMQWTGYYGVSVGSGGSVSIWLISSDCGDVSALSQCVQGWVGSGDNQTSPPFSGNNPPGGGSNPPDGGNNPPDGGNNPPDGGSNPPDGGSNPPDGGNNPPNGGSNPPDGGNNPPDGGNNPPDSGNNPPNGGVVDGVPVPPAGGPAGGVPGSPEVPETPKSPGDVVQPTPGHPCFGGDVDSVYFVAPANYQPRTEFGESIVWRSGDACDYRDVIVSGDFVVANSGDLSAEQVNGLLDRVRSGGGVSRVVIPRFEKDYVVVRQKISDAVAGCHGVVRVVEQTAHGWDRPELLAAAGRQDLLFEFGGEVPELFRVEELEVSVIRQRLESLGEASFNGQVVLAAVLESSDRPVRVSEVRGSVVICDSSLDAADIGTSVSKSAGEVDSAFRGFETRLRSVADSMSAGLVTALSVEPCAECPGLPIPTLERNRVVWREDRSWCGPLSSARGSLRLGVGMGVLVLVLGMWVKFWSFVTGGDS